jgi:hypothetical protein
VPIIEHDHPAVAFLPRRLGEADAVGLHMPVLGPEVGGVQEQSDAATGRSPTHAACSGVAALASSEAAPRPSGGATTTQRLPSPRGVSSMMAKRKTSVKKAMASS